MSTLRACAMQPHTMKGEARGLTTFEVSDSLNAAPLSMRIVSFSSSMPRSKNSNSMLLPNWTVIH